jgi:hypothetical protein
VSAWSAPTAGSPAAQGVGVDTHPVSKGDSSILKSLGATPAIAFIAATAGQALARNPQPLPPGPRPHYVVSHVLPRCPPARGFARTRV